MSDRADDLLRHDADRWRASQDAPPPLTVVLSRATARRGPGTGAVVGAAVGALVLIAAVVAAGVWVRSQHRPAPNLPVGTPAEPSPTAARPSPTPATPSATPTPTSDTGALSGVTWQLTAFVADGAATAPAGGYPLNLVITADGYQTSSLGLWSTGAVTASGGTVRFVQASVSLADMAVPPGIDEAQLSAASAEGQRLLDRLAAMTAYRRDGDRLTLSDAAGEGLEFLALPTDELARLQALARAVELPGPSFAVQAVRTTYGAYLAVAPPFPRPTAPGLTAQTPVWVLQWTGAFTVPHSCPAGSPPELCAWHVTAFVAAVPADAVDAAAVFEAYPVIPDQGEAPLDLAAWGTPVALAAF